MRQIEEEMRRREEEARKQAQAQGEAYETVDLGNISFIWPCPSSRRITSAFGDRESPTEGASSNHKGVDIGAPFPEVGGQLEEFLELGGQVCICNACMIHNGFQPEQMDPRYVLINAPDVVTLLMGAKGSLQIT